MIINLDILIDGVMHEDAELTIEYDYNYEAPSWDHPGDDTVDLTEVLFNGDDIFFKLTQEQYSQIVDMVYENMPERNTAWDEQP